MKGRRGVSGRLVLGWFAMLGFKAKSRPGQASGCGPHRQSAVLLVLGCLMGMLGLSGCGEFFTPVNNSGTTTGSTTYVYVTNVDSSGSGGTLSAYTSKSGVLTAINGSPYSLPATPTSIVVAPNNAFLYVGTDSGVFLYTIGSGGVLTEGNSATVVYLNATNPTVESLAVDSTSSWLLIANQNSSELDALAIDPTLGTAPSTPIAAKALSYAGPVQLSISPANNNVAVALNSGGTNVYGFNAANTADPWGSEVTIALQKGATAALNSTNANTVGFDTTSTYLFVGEAQASSTTDLLRVIPVASLNQDAADYATGKGPTSILADASGAYVYVANATDNTISGFSISAGVLTALTDSPFSAPKISTALLEDSTKTYVLDVGYGTNPNLYTYTFDSASAGTLDISSTTSTGSADPSLGNAMALSH